MLDFSLPNTAGGTGWKDSTGWTNPLNKSFGTVGTECDWERVAPAQAAITKIDLTDDGLVGSIPAETGNLLEFRKPSSCGKFVNWKHTGRIG